MFVGEGELRSTLHRMAIDLGVERACRFMGVREDIADILAAADVVVLPSLSEGFPFVLLEALAMGCPVVASRVNGIPELIEDHKTGLLVPARDPHALMVAIREMLSDPIAAVKMGAEGRAVVRERFTVDHMVGNTTAIFDAALQDAGIRVPIRETDGSVKQAAMPETEQIVCPCGSQAMPVDVFQTPTRRYVRCPDCELVFLNPRPLGTMVEAVLPGGLRRGLWRGRGVVGSPPGV